MFIAEFLLCVAMKCNPIEGTPLMVFVDKEKCLTFAHEAAGAVVLQLNDKNYSVAYRCVKTKESQYI
jgi:hypothetical protein